MSADCHPLLAGVHPAFLDHLFFVYTAIRISTCYSSSVLVPSSYYTRGCVKAHSGIEIESLVQSTDLQYENRISKTSISHAHLWIFDSDYTVNIVRLLMRYLHLKSVNKALNNSLICFVSRIDNPSESRRTRVGAPL